MRIKHRYGFSSGNRQVMRFLKQQNNTNVLTKMYR